MFRCLEVLMLVYSIYKIPPPTSSSPPPAAAFASLRFAIAQLEQIGALDGSVWLRYRNGLAEAEPEQNPPHHTWLTSL
jgi:hypothetical protein